MPVIYSYSSSGRTRDGTGAGLRESRGGIPSRSASSRSTYSGTNRNGSASRIGLGRRNSSSVVDGVAAGSGAGSGGDPEPTDADDSIVLSDLVRTGEASRLRRRGAMRLDHYHRDSLPPNENPSSGTRSTGLGSRASTSSLRSMEPFLSVLRANPTRTIPARLDTSSNPSQGDDWVQPATLRRSSVNIASTRGNPDPWDIESESYTYSLFCGYELEPGTEEYAAYEERWAEEEFIRKQMCSEPFTPSPFPLLPPSTSTSPKGKEKAMPSSPPRVNGCGALLHLRAAPRARMGVWMAKTEATEAVVALDPDLFVDPDSDASSRFSLGGSSNTPESRAASAVVKVVKSACGCIREGVGCAACGNPLGTRYKPCKTAVESIFSNTGSSRSRNADTSVSGLPLPSQNLGRPEGPQGPAYWRTSSSLSQLHPEPPISSTPSSQTSSPSPTNSTDHPYSIYTFFSSAVSSSPRFSFPSPRNSNTTSTSSSRPSTSRYPSNLSNASSNSNTSSATTRPSIFTHTNSRIGPGSLPLPSRTSSSSLTPISPYVLVPSSTSDAPPIMPTPSSAVTASALNISSNVPVSMPYPAAVTERASGNRDEHDDSDRDDDDVVVRAETGREIRNRPSIASLASTVTVVSEDGANGNDRSERRDGELEGERLSREGRLPISDILEIEAVEIESELSTSTSSPSTATPYPNFPSAVESQAETSASGHQDGAHEDDEVGRRAGRPLPRRRARIGEDEAEEALRRVYGAQDSDEMLLHMLTGNFTLQGDDQGSSPRSSARTILPVPDSPVSISATEDERGGLGDGEVDAPGQAPGTAVESVVNVTGPSVDETPIAAAVDSMPLLSELQSTSIDSSRPTANAVPGLETTTSSRPSSSTSSVPSALPEAGRQTGVVVPDSPGFTAPVSLTTPIPTTPSLHHMLEPDVMHSVSENMENVELRAGAELTAQGTSQGVEENSDLSQATDLDMGTVHTHHVLALVRRARQQAQERREVMLDLLMGATPYIRDGTGLGDNNTTHTRSSSVPSSPSSTTSSLPPLVFPPTPTSPSLSSSPTSSIRSSARMSRLTDLIRNVRVVAETTGMERQREWSAFEEWMSLGENRAHGHAETGQTREAATHRNEDVSRDGFEFDSDTESELEGRIMIRQSGPPTSFMSRVRPRRDFEADGDDDEGDEDSWSLPSMPSLQDVSDSDDGMPGVWEDSSDDDEDRSGDIEAEENSREESSRTQLRDGSLDPDGEFLDSLEGDAEDLNKPSEAGRARMGVRVPANIIAGR
ncbi:hypothetical protein D9758_007718 [Tetrapyrgos nigripes]|uniref:Uncharacterized protein n=1 Tax=Tetrapyrgos nigripes TaxID=182062 RepID=A0A8H5LIQ1_9AGAR|nr:hypothetical protein D9758_007718 [Tetrapyrgos nigripes]